jgi:hypothetical protein
MAATIQHDTVAAFINNDMSQETFTRETSWKNDGSHAMQVALRYWHNYSERAALIPVARIVSYSNAGKWSSNSTYMEYETEDTLRSNTRQTWSNHADSTYKLTATDVRLGLGHNWKPIEDVLAIFEVGVSLHGEKTESSRHWTSSYDSVHTVAETGATEEKHRSTDSTRSFSSKMTMNSLPYWRLGFETNIFPWLSGRLGAERRWVSRTWDKVSFYRPENKGTYSLTSTYLGATAHWHRLVLDLLVEPNFMGSGPNFISGYNGMLFSRVSLKYDFNK